MTYLILSAPVWLLALAYVAEAIAATGMRSRARQRGALDRYLSLI